MITDGFSRAPMADAQITQSHGDYMILQPRAVTEKPTTAMIVLIHGVLMSMAFAFMFPFGSALARMLKFRGGMWIHGVWQSVAWLVSVVGLAFGALFIKRVGKYATHHHPILGMVVIALLILQPLTGAIAHKRFKTAGRNWNGAVHRWFGRVVLLAGIVNGWLGIRLKSNSHKWLVGYSIPAAFFTALWVGVSVYDWIKVRRHATRASLDTDEKPIKTSSVAS